MITLRVLSFSLIVVLAVAGCSKDTTGPSSNACSEVSVSPNGVSISCSNVNQSVTGISYDNFGRVVAYNYSSTCNTNGKNYTGRATFSYNNLGQVTSSTLTVNGATCR